MSLLANIFISSDYKWINHVFLVQKNLLYDLFISPLIHLEFTHELCELLVQFFFLPSFYQDTHHKLLKSHFFLSNLRSFYILNVQVCFSILSLNFRFCSTDSSGCWCASSNRKQSSSITQWLLESQVLCLLQIKIGALGVLGKDISRNRFSN